MTSLLTLPPAEITEITGGRKQPRRQLEELHRRGYWRAYLGVHGQVVLDRAHYEAVCAGALPSGAGARDTTGRPQLRSVAKTA